MCGRSVGEGIKTSSAEWGKVKLLVKHNACYKHTNSIGKIMVYIPNAITSHTDTFQEANGVQINSFSLNNVLNSYNYCFMTTTCITSEDNAPKRLSTLGHGGINIYILEYYLIICH